MGPSQYYPHHLSSTQQDAVIDPAAESDPQVWCVFTGSYHDRRQSRGGWGVVIDPPADRLCKLGGCVSASPNSAYRMGLLAAVKGLEHVKARLDADSTVHLIVADQTVLRDQKKHPDLGQELKQLRTELGVSCAFPSRFKRLGPLERGFLHRARKIAHQCARGGAAHNC